jgi:predicted transcriptional regulator
MAATSLKLSDALKRRIEQLASRAGKSPHSYMVDALTREAEQAERREQFAADADRSEQEAMAGGKAYSLAATFEYLDKRLSGRKAVRPRPHAWRGSK